MPELPEVENVRRQLARWCAGRRVVRLEVLDAAVVRTKLSTRPGDADSAGVERLRGALLAGVLPEPLRYGKRLGWLLGDAGLLLHLGMTGRWLAGAATTRSTRLVLALDDGQQVQFADTRRFGCVVVCEAADLTGLLRDRLGPDPTEQGLDGGTLRARLRGRRAVKVALMDQSVLAGLGNIHAAEALFHAQIHPATRCDALGDAEMGRLAACILRQLEQTIAELGDQPVHYVTDGGPNPFAVYGRREQPCPRCGGDVDAIDLGGRSSFFCARCQPLRAQG